MEGFKNPSIVFRKIEMPISPKDVLPYVYASDAGDRIILAIDLTLGSTIEAKYRVHTFEGSSDFVYLFKCREKITDQDRKLIISSYRSAGWSNVIVDNHTLENSTLIALTAVDFFENGTLYDMRVLAADPEKFELLDTTFDKK